MNTVTKRMWWRRILLLLGTGFIIAGVAAGYFWFYRLAPLRHIVDPNWQRTHSASAIWAEEQENYRRTNESPDTFFQGNMIGYYGDKAWALWLVENLKNDKDFRFCGCTESVLSRMTNQCIIGDRDAWIEWFREHEGESQEQWIQQGFAKYGVTVHLPPTEEDREVLLTLLANNDKDADGVSKIPAELRYNAFRWLRDSGFSWRDYLDAHPDWRISERLVAGTFRYVTCLELFPAGDGLGRLALSDDRSSPDETSFLSPLVSPAAKATAYGTIFGGLILGVSLLTIAIRMKQHRQITTTSQVIP